MAADDAGRFVALGELKAVGTATLRNGATATLHEFVGVANCPAGAAGQLARLFKPYMEFDRCGRPDLPQLGSRIELPDQPRASQIDRSSDVLRP